MQIQRVNFSPFNRPFPAEALEKVRESRGMMGKATIFKSRIAFQTLYAKKVLHSILGRTVPGTFTSRRMKNLCSNNIRKFVTIYRLGGIVQFLQHEILIPLQQRTRRSQTSTKQWINWVIWNTPDVREESRERTMPDVGHFSNEISSSPWITVIVIGSSCREITEQGKSNVKFEICALRMTISKIIILNQWLVLLPQVGFRLSTVDNSRQYLYDNIKSLAKKKKCRDIHQRGSSREMRQRNGIWSRNYKWPSKFDPLNTT